MKPAKNNYTVGFRIWINEEKGHFLGLGRIRLLEHIRDTGSITQGAKAMKMSYRQAWQMVEDMNARTAHPLVAKTLGGKGGGGATVTSEGEHAIKLFYLLEQEMAAFCERLSEKVKL